MTEVTKLYTADEFWEEFGGQKHIELVRGVPVRMSPTGRVHGLISLALGALIMQYVDQHELGETYGAETGFRLHSDPDLVRAPDISVVSKTRAAALTIEGYIPGPPDLAVEVVSPSDRARDIQAKVADFLAAGTRLIWVVYPDTRTVVAHYPDGTARTFAEADTLDGGDALPGFALPVTEVFKKLPTD